MVVVVDEDQARLDLGVAVEAGAEQLSVEGPVRLGVRRRVDGEEGAAPPQVRLEGVASLGCQDGAGRGDQYDDGAPGKPLGVKAPGSSVTSAAHPSSSASSVSAAAPSGIESWR